MRRNLLMLALPLAVGLSACGGGAPTRAAFAFKADAGCAPMGLGGLEGITKPADHPQLATGAGTLLRAVDAQLTQLRTLDQPGGDAKVQVEGLMGAMGSLSQSTRALQQGASAKDDAAVSRALNDTTSRYQDASSKATEIGMTSCVLGMKSTVDQLSVGSKEIVKSSYLTKGDALCDAAGKKLEALPEPSSSKGLPAVGRYFDLGLPILTKLVVDLKALTPPPGDEATVADIIAAQDAGIAKIKEFRDAAIANDARKVLALEKEFDSSLSLADAKLVSYGFKTCGNI